MPRGKVCLRLVPIARWCLTPPLLIIKHFHCVFLFAFYSSELRLFRLIQTRLLGQKVRFLSSVRAPASRLLLLLCGVGRWWLDKENCPLVFCWFAFSQLNLLNQSTPRTICTSAKEGTDARGWPTSVTETPVPLGFALCVLCLLICLFWGDCASVWCGASPVALFILVVLAWSAHLSDMPVSILSF